VTSTTCRRCGQNFDSAKGRATHERRGHDVVSRLWDRVEKTDTCWLWTGSRTRNGYGQMSVGNKMKKVHRIAWEMLRWPVPDGLSLDHLCRVRHCVRPSHLEPVDHRTNVLRGEGISAVNAQKTHCTHGHEFTPENTMLRRRGGRDCRVCHQERGRRASRAYYWRQKAAA
jgi:hypothetical protein